MIDSMQKESVRSDNPIQRKRQHLSKTAKSNHILVAVKFYYNLKQNLPQRKQQKIIKFKKNKKYPNNCCQVNPKLLSDDRKTNYLLSDDTNYN